MKTMRTDITLRVESSLFSARFRSRAGEEDSRYVHELMTSWLINCIVVKQLRTIRYMSF